MRVFLILLVVAGCVSAEPEDARRVTVQNLLVEDNLDLLYRDPDLVAGKFAKMASSRYRYFRGSLRVFLHDLSAAPGRIPTAYGSGRSSLVALVGDPHPENLGTFLRDGDLVVDWNDFDAAWYGPYSFDVRRLAIGFYLLAREAGAAPAAATTLATEVARGYAASFSGTPGERLLADARPGDAGGAVYADVLEEAAEDGDAGKPLAKYTRVSGTARSLHFSDARLDPAGFVDSEFSPLPAAETARVTALVARYRQIIPAVAAEVVIKGIGRRVGAGVASYALPRYYVLIEGPTTVPDDDRILELREVRDPPLFDRRRPIFPAHPFESNGDRVTSLMQAAHGTAANDRFAGWATEGALAYRILELTGYQQEIEVDRIVERIDKQKMSLADVTQAARYAGALLAAAHRRAQSSATAAIAAALRGDIPGFTAETQTFIARYGPAVEADHALFAACLQQEGPLLGARIR